MPVDVSRDSNPNMSIAQSAPVTRYRASPDLQSTYTDGANVLAITAGVTLERTSPEQEAGRQDPRLRVAWRNSSPRTSTEVFAAHEQNAYRNLAIGELVPLGVDGTRRFTAFGAAMTSELSEVKTVTLTIGHEATRFSTPGTANYGVTSGSAQYTQALNELSAWYVAGDTQLYRSEAGPGIASSHSRSDGVVFGYRTSLLENALQFDGSTGWSRSSGPSDASSRRGTLKATYAQAFTDFSFEVSRRSSPLVSTSSLGTVTVMRLASRTSVSADTSVLLEFERSTTKAFPRSTADKVSLAVARQLSPVMQASLRAERRGREDILAGRAQSTILSASLTYSFPDF